MYLKDGFGRIDKSSLVLKDKAFWSIKEVQDNKAVYKMITQKQRIKLGTFPYLAWEQLLSY